MDLKEPKDLSNMQLEIALKDFEDRIKFTDSLKIYNTSVFSDSQILEMNYKYNEIKKEIINELKSRGVYEIIVKNK